LVKFRHLMPNLGKYFSVQTYHRSKGPVRRISDKFEECHIFAT
jgi:hypothetical protein